MNPFIIFFLHDYIREVLQMQHKDILLYACVKSNL